MASSDDTYYNMKRLHVVFAISSLALLAVTVWLVIADHRRDWKVYQRTFRDRVEPWLTEARVREEQSEKFRAREDQLGNALNAARAAMPDRKLIERFVEEVAQTGSEEEPAAASTAEIEAAYQRLVANPGIEARKGLLAELSRHVTAASHRRENVDRQLRFRRAEFDEARSFYEAGVGEGLAQRELDDLQGRVDRCKQRVDALAASAEQASAHDEALVEILGKITGEEDDARQALDDHRAVVARLDRAFEQQRPNVGKQLLQFPLIDALGRPLAIDQIWLPDLTIDYNFRQVARFDRCTTCHQGIARTAPGSPSEPACLGEEVLTVRLAAPTRRADSAEGEDASTDANRALDEEEGRNPLIEHFGLALADAGILEPGAATIGLVLPLTPAADAELLPGDRIERINGTEIHDPEQAIDTLLDGRQWDKPFELRIRRGLPHPYHSHPRLDLFVGSLSPHPASEFGCTICHDGQGSATEFKFVSHTPNDPLQRDGWRKQHGWFWNHYWDFPMRPRRFAQSNCLKCHHAVTDLAPSRRFPDPPAAQLLAGYHLVRTNGCFGCHEIKGVTASGEVAGPDMRLEPNYHEAALQLLAGSGLIEEQRLLARQTGEHPEDSEARRQLVSSLRVDAAEGQAGGPGRLQAASVAVKVLAEEDPTPGTMRKVGSSLRDVAGKLDARFLDQWLHDSTPFRPDTRMPRFYGMHEHLDGKSLDDAKRFEAAEIYAVTEYLLAISQPVEPLQASAEVTEAPSAARGRQLFLTQGCAACHKHDDYPEGQSVQGPNLSRLGSKLTTGLGRRWLVSWIRDPRRHAPRTLMPNALLEPLPLEQTEGGANEDAAEKGAGSGRDDQPTRPRMSDPAADIAAYLLSFTGPAGQPETRQALVESDLDDLVLLHLSQSLSKRRARQYLEGAFPLTPEQAQGDLIELLGRVTRQKKTRYLGRRTIRKRGCYGCHDVPGFEDAQLIGPALSDWGRKQESLLAFEQVHRFVAEEPGAEEDPDRGFYVEALLGKRREGFIWQKLRAPRSFDYKKTENKGYNEQLTMGRFSLTPAEREAIITFVLGLVAEPPAEQYVYRGDRRQRAIVQGRKVLDQYGCAECHTLELERWMIRYDPEEVEGPYEVEDFAFLRPQIDTRRRETSTKLDRRGLLRAEAVGMPQMDERGEVLEDVDDDDHPMYYLNLWEPLAMKAQGDWVIWSVGGAQLGVSDPRQIATRPPEAGASPESSLEQQMRPTYTPHLTARRLPVGGAFARMLFPRVLDDENPAVMEAWGWVPPPLVDEGRKVQPAWLHDYLLEPFPIRPAVVLRMPKFSLSSTETGKLVDYFAAAAGVDFPYSSDPRSRSSGLEAKELRRPNRLDDAMRILIDRTTFCTKCHLVGDFSPGGETQTVLGPRLDRVGRRIRPEHLRRWLANPKSLLPYTGMPVNFPPSGPSLGQDLFEGSSVEQIDAVVDLLLNYDWYISRRTSIREMIEAAEKAGSGAASDGS